jgi:hypothetical protein
MAPPSSNGTTPNRQGLLNFSFSIGPVAQASAAAITTTANTLQAVRATTQSDDSTEDEVEGDVVAHSEDAPAPEEGGEGEDIPEQATIAEREDGENTVTEHQVSTAEGREEEQEENEDEGGPGIGGGGTINNPTGGEGEPPGEEVQQTNPLLGGQPDDAQNSWTAGLDSRQDLLGASLSEADRRLIDVYGDTIHDNTGRHLHGGIDAATDTLHMEWFDCVVAHPHRLYLPLR